MAKVIAPRFLAYGDSLTAGYHSNGAAFEPYAATLQTELRKECCPDCRVEVSGASGAQVFKLAKELDVERALDVASQRIIATRTPEQQMSNRNPQDNSSFMDAVE